MTTTTDRKYILNAEILGAMDIDANGAFTGLEAADAIGQVDTELSSGINGANILSAINSAYAKAAGNYAAQFYPTILAKNQGYQQIIWTDSSTHEYIEEAGTMNLFFRIEDKLITAPTSDSILDGITRKSLIKIAKDLGIDIEVRPLKVDEILKAAKNNSLKEIFGSGTAVVVLPICGFGYENEKFELPKIENPWSAVFKKKLNDIQCNLSEDPYGWRIKP